MATPKTILLFLSALSVLPLLAVSADVDVDADAVVNSTCAATLYPELCVSTIALAAVPMKSSKDVLLTALNYSIKTVGRNFFTIKKIGLQEKASLTRREKGALHDCLEMIADTLDQLHDSAIELAEFGFKNYSLVAHKEHLLTLLSAAQTNQDSCLDGFSHEGADEKVRGVLIAGQKHVFRLVSNVMAIIKKFCDTESAAAAKLQSAPEARRLGEENQHGEWPEWLSAGDRRLLQASTVTPDVTVAADGSGNYRTVAAAVAAAPEGSSRRYVIRIKAGVYRESVEIPKKKTNLMFVGDGRTNTIITASKNVVDGSTTFNSATVG